MPSITTVISEFAHPPWGTLQRELIGTFDHSTSPGVLQRVRGPINVDAFGMAWEFTTVPAAAGYQLGVTKTYTDRVLQLAVEYTDILGHDFFGEIHDIHQEGLYTLFEQPLPTSVQYFVFPNYEVTLFWLLAL